MKLVNVDKTFRIYSDNLKVLDQLPPAVYIVRFSQMQGFYLESYNALEVQEEKVYGVHESKIIKVMRAFKDFTRNLGVILSGDKGIGKSLFARMLSQAAIGYGHPVIVVDQYVPGIHNFIEEIEQECMVLFDEFDKTFPSGNGNNGNNGMGNDGQSPQASLLSLLDGVSSGKKLFAVTCNRFHNLNEYLINRPGRFHYHIRFDYPVAEEVETYLKDKLAKEYWGEIDKVVNFAGKVNLNYDCLRAIVYELATGEKFESAILDLNILNVNDNKYDVEVTYEDGTTGSRGGVRIDMFSARKESISLRDIPGYEVYVEFIPKEIKFNNLRGCSYGDASNFKMTFIPEYREDDDTALPAKPVPMHITIRPQSRTQYHYAL